MNWRGRPLTSHEVVVACIAATRTRSGLRVEAELDHSSYPLGLAVSKAELKCLSVQQAALIENRRHRQPHQPGTRGGVFRQKITDAERILAAVLNERKIANRHVLAAAFGISFRTLSNALADALPVLHEAGITIPRSASRFASAEEILVPIHFPHQNDPPSTDTPTR